MNAYPCCTAYRAPIGKLPILPTVVCVFAYNSRKDRCIHRLPPKRCQYFKFFLVFRRHLGMGSRKHLQGMPARNTRYRPKIEQYCEALWIKINLSKTVVLPFDNKRWEEDDFTVNIYGSDESATCQGRFLAVTIDSKLSCQTTRRRL